MSDELYDCCKLTLYNARLEMAQEAKGAQMVLKASEQTRKEASEIHESVARSLQHARKIQGILLGFVERTALWECLCDPEEGTSYCPSCEAKRILSNEKKENSNGKS